MRVLALSCLALFTVAVSLAEPVEAGRRQRRRAGAAAGVAVAATRPVVAVTRRRTVPAAVVRTPEWC